MADYYDLFSIPPEAGEEGKEFISSHPNAIEGAQAAAGYPDAKYWETGGTGRQFSKRETIVDDGLEYRPYLIQYRKEDDPIPDVVTVTLRRGGELQVQVSSAELATHWDQGTVHVLVAQALLDLPHTIVLTDPNDNTMNMPTAP
ncbi:hypothetical protein ACFQ6Q_00635 [Streptomyces sp. NPDC056437]|uniref:hypothetical protein n=1 Tax=Streptomyces sp. NPDC056437 TaxID=3345816 RepID=UPI0036A40223